MTDEDLKSLMAFYKAGRAADGFERGVRDALSAILASPHFLYRAESGDAAGGTRTLNDLELASRLSFFLWSSLPDEELLDLAVQSRLSEPEVLAKQVRRMLADERSESLVDDFTFQWLNLAKLDEITPDGRQFPQASGLLDPRDLYKEELRLFIDSVLRSDRSVVELMTADYTFLNERLAMLYGIETVKGSHFRRVTLEDDDAPRPAGQRRHPDVDRVSQSHVAGAARRLDPGPPSRLAAVAAASECPGTGGKQARTAGANGTRANGTASLESDLFRLSRRDGSTRVCVGEFQRGGAVPDS